MNPFVPIAAAFLALKQSRKTCHCDACRNKRPEAFNKLEGLMVIVMAIVSVGGLAHVIYLHLTR